ncbi:MAG: S-methyl-5-thioribose-1-phosphate isomerase [Desulfobacterales bacterium]|nr:S-methyl-5-thioribose-1-phosphate isomerase [Desulfobacterales bacterium]
MLVDEKQMRPIWLDNATDTVKVIDQRQLPHELVILELHTVENVITAIKEMVVRGAPLIGVTAAYGVFIAAKNIPDGREFSQRLTEACRRIRDARPTAVNLAWAVDRMRRAVTSARWQRECIDIARAEAGLLAEEEAVNCKEIGAHGLKLVAEARAKKGGGTVNILTHCNAGWLACVEYGTATAPIYAAAQAGIDVHVWVDETRPLNQGARLTAWELGKCGIAHTVITDNAGGHLMQHGMVDMVIVGTDRTTYTGDVANKIGTYLKALAAKDNHIPFYVALPSSTFDWQISDGIHDIPIEARNPDEVRYVTGFHNGETTSVLIPPATSPAANYAFDVTPARLVTAFITEKGICKATPESIGRLFPGKIGAPAGKPLHDDKLDTI